MQPWSKITHYAGFDWAHDHHEVVIVNPSGKIVTDFQIEHSRRLAALARASRRSRPWGGCLC